MTTPPEPQPQPEPRVIERGSGYSVAWSDTLDPNPQPTEEQQ